jgi:predicted peptidase
MAETGFLDRVAMAGGVKRRYQVYVPPGWTARKTWPVILFLHGSGERGDDGLLQTQVGLASAIRRNRRRFDRFVVVFAQSSRRVFFWLDRSAQRQAMAALEQTVAEFNGDRGRLYLTGLSMGGYGTISMAGRYPGVFAAAAAVCGGLRAPQRFPDLRDKIKIPRGVDPYAQAARKIGKLPMWLFHGAADEVVPVEESRKLAAALKAAGGNVRYTEFPKEGHGSWGAAYDHPRLLGWLLRQKIRQV